ncbi:MULTISPECIES: type II toxin-antitoxin system RelE family toxin [Streptomyces]|uniref:Type II toxin-antitoxin system RelE/ParE family toxin n=1 Tax=Streptomyces dengpaensis TaxID=2049881 RepID=A0ABM6T1A3_9ACTN|nr:MULTISPECIES: type II toxin-antitoxin system RelE/ParE family toxin [Streptomyces]AVH60761.1 hypothetical protein C4B68_39030 [Streptomyces dengpaensis]PIB04235.1 hypothetical protein B1C81_33765 [Streptomyces sp. HG99]
MAKHARGRARIFFSDSAAKQIEAITDEAEIHALDRALTALSVAPDLGSPIPGSHPELRDYADDVDDVRVIYYVSALRTVVVVAYVEA